MKPAISLIIIFLFGLSAVSSYAEMHKWVDEKGRTWITDYPEPKAAKKKMLEKAKDADQTQDAKAPDAKPGETDKTDQKNDISKFLPLPDSLRKQIDAFPRADTMSVLPGPFMALLSGFLVILAVACLAAYIFHSLCLYLIAKKLAVPNPWLAWIPIANLWTVSAAAGREWWWAVILIALGVLSASPAIGIIFNLACVGCWVYLWMCITANLGRNKWLGLLIVLPIVNFIWMGILAFSKDQEPLHPSNMNAGQS